MITLPALCLALAVYFEARSESLPGQVAVAFVILNRVDDKRWPSNICDVVYQPHQFSFLWDGKSDRPTDREAWKVAQVVAKAAMSGSVGDPSLGATHYHTQQVNPYWSKGVTPTVTFGNHHFYRM